MVSKARLDLPDPDSPVITIMRSRGSSTETFLRLWTRAPCAEMVVLGALRSVALPAINRLRKEERQLLEGGVASFGQQHGRRRLADQLEVREVLARGGHAGDAEVLGEVI